MKLATLALATLLVVGCAPRYQTTTSADGQTVLRTDTQTGKVEFYASGQWHPLPEQRAKQDVWQALGYR